MFEPAPPDQPAILPASIERLLARCKRRERPLFVAAAAFQIVLLAWMAIAGATSRAALATADTILVPVNMNVYPGLFTGEYAYLWYEFNYVPDNGIDGIPRKTLRWDDKQFPDGTPVYVMLEPVPGGRIWRAAGMSLERPESGTYLTGRLEGYEGIRYGIEEWNLPERELPRYNRAAHQKRLCAEIAITEDGIARLRGLRITAEPIGIDPPSPPEGHVETCQESLPPADAHQTSPTEG